MSLKDRVAKCLGEDAIVITEHMGDISVEVPRERIVSVLTRLKEDPDTGFDFLSDLFGVDNLDWYAKKKKKKPKKKAEGEEEPVEEDKGPPPPRFEVIYLLLALKTNERLQVKIRVPEDDMTVDTVTTIWKAADWPEREAFDMFGFKFRGHHNLRRLLMWDEFEDHPLRKDYPLEGKGEERHLSYD
jgi:NADH-quinone oxidoreductase subunit C